MQETGAWASPPDHPITPEQARAFIEGDGADVLGHILMSAMAPIYWHAPTTSGERGIVGNGTLTIARSRQRLFAVTAYHVVDGYFAARDADPRTICQIGNLPFDQLMSRIIDRSGYRDDTDDNDGRHDLCTIEITEAEVTALRKEPVTLGDSPGVQEGRGILFGGFPGAWRRELAPREAEFRGLRGIGVSVRVSDTQITWVRDPDLDTHVAGLPELQPHANLGGISGGPMIGLFETPGHILYFQLAGIIVEAIQSLDNLVARSSHLLRPDGTIRRR